MKHASRLALQALAATALFSTAGGAPAAGSTLNVSVGVTVVPASGVCGSSSGGGVISVACVAPAPPPSSGGGGAIPVAPAVPVAPVPPIVAGPPTTPATPPAPAAPTPTAPVPPPVAATPSAPSPDSASPTVPSGPGPVAASPAPFTPVVPASNPPLFATPFQLVVSAALAAAMGETGTAPGSAGGNEALPSALRRVLAPSMIAGAGPLAVYSYRADVSGYRTVAADNGAYVEIIIAW